MAVKQPAARDWTSLLAAAIGFATVVAYVAIIINQDTERSDYPFAAFVTLYFAVLSVAALASATATGRRSVALRSAATAGFLFWGLIAAASIGLLLLIAGLIALVALIRTLRVEPGSGMYAALIAFATVLTGVVGIVGTSALG
ncbi:MAG: hypothetical protein AB7I38_06545 [Dehalococcoidia bacterium]